jgi:hypothetical protein
MSAPTRNRPHRAGKVSPRAISAWKDVLSKFNSFVRNDPNETLVRTNPEPNPNRNMWSLGSSLRRQPSLGLSVTPDWNLEDGQLNFPALRNYSATVYAISNEQVSKDTVALIEHL